MTTYPMCGGCSVVLTPERHVHYEGGVGCCSVSCCKTVEERQAIKKPTSDLQEQRDALLAACKAIDSAIVGCRVGEIGPNEMLAAIGRAGIEAAIAKAEKTDK